LVAGANEFSPEALERGDVDALRRRFAAIDETREEYRAFAFPKGDSNYAITRSYRGPSVMDLQSSAAFVVLNSVISDRVTHHNRGDQGLGYVHVSSARAFDEKDHYLTFIGQTDGVDNAKRTMQGWSDVLEMLRTGQITDEQIESSIQGVRNELTQQKTSAAQFLAAYRMYSDLRMDPRADEKIAAYLVDMRPAQVREVANRFLFAEANPPYLQLTLGNCERLLAKR
jgi:predicted Zn-dependent peptidase